MAALDAWAAPTFGGHDRTPIPTGEGPLGVDAAAAAAARCLYCAEAPCVDACPTHIDVPSFIRKIATGNLEGSARTILSANPLGATCARVCPVERLCEGACVRVPIDGPVPIGRLQRHAMDALAASAAPFFDAGPAAPGRVAVVGGGPAGAACAAELRRLGLAVTVFEARRAAGGLCSHGIVPWRHSRETTALELRELERAGVEIRTGTRVGADVSADDLLRDHDAVFLAVGLGRGRRLGIPGERLDGVVDALDLLDAFVGGDHAAVPVGRRVGVIGGGSTAMDAAAAAVALDAEDVTVFYRRTEAEAPAYPHAIDVARSLGVRLRWLVGPVAIEGADGRVTGARFERMRLGPPDGGGRRSVRPVPHGRFSVELDTLVLAVGQDGIPALLDAFGLDHVDGRIVVEQGSGRTSNPRVWAGGDAASGGREVVHAVEDGKQAARSIAAALGVPARPRIDPAVATVDRVELAVDMAGIRSPNPFWLASSPVSNTGEMVARAFDAGWGGAVWKTVGDPIVNVTSRLGALHLDGRRMAGISNIELISDRPIEVNLAEIRDVKRRYPDRAVVVSLMVESKREAWHDIVRRVNDTGADGVELNFGCPHGMSERGMGSAVGQVPAYTRMITEWVKEVAEVPVLVKLTPNVTDITSIARAARAGGADGIALINTINSLVGVALDTWVPSPGVRDRASHGGYAGPAVKPIALHLVSACARDPEVGIPISGIGGVVDWRDAVEFLLLGATTVQVCTAVMHHGYRIADDLVDGLSRYLRDRGLQRPADLVGRAVPAVGAWGELDLSYRLVARIDPERCILCGLCERACADGAHQAISRRTNGRTELRVDDAACVGCRLCEFVCPVDGTVTLVEAAPVG
jgi:dihydropyrimidine dehydrogenase (NAD+) subunit PreA